jgi:uncharacterized protein (TIGR02996 family)
MDKDDFIRAICADPEDDTVRLAYADWLDERDSAGDLCNCDTYNATGSLLTAEEASRCEKCGGSGWLVPPNDYADRAEFIRIQIELQKYPKETAWLEQMPVEQWIGDPADGELLRRLDPLVKRHLAICKQYVREVAVWSREFISALLGADYLNRSATWQWYWCRGFVQEIELPLESFVRCAKDIFSGQPIQRVKLTGVVRGDIVFRTSNGHTNDIAKEVWEELGIPKCTLKVNDCWQRGTHAHMTEDELSAYLVAYGRRLADLPRL